MRRFLILVLGIALYGCSEVEVRHQFVGTWIYDNGYPPGSWLTLKANGDYSEYIHHPIPEERHGTYRVGGEFAALSLTMTNDAGTTTLPVEIAGNTMILRVDDGQGLRLYRTEP